MRRVFHIVAPGPSLDWSSWEYTGSPVICINLALSGASQCDFWVCHDKPNQIHEQCLEDAKRLYPKVLTKGKWAKRWEDTFGLTVLNGYRETSDSWVWQYKGTAKNYSIFLAIAYALTKGAEEFRFTGVDMRGAGYFKDVSFEWDSDLAKAWDDRWEDEETVPVVNILREAKRRDIALVGLPPHVVKKLEEERVEK